MDNQQQSVLSSLQEAYVTTDFDFAAYLITRLVESTGTQPQQPMASLVSVRPHAFNPRRQGAGHRFEFCLVPCAQLSVNALREEQMAYTNRRTQVEPLAFMTARQQLRALIDIEINKINNMRRTSNHSAGNRNTTQG